MTEERPTGAALPGAAPATAPAAGGSPAQGVPAQAPEQALDPQALQAKLQKYEQDIRALKSSYDRKYAEDKSSWDQERDELQQRLTALATAGMNEQEKREFEFEQIRLERDRLRDQHLGLQQQIERERNQMAYVTSLNSLGVDVRQLDYTNEETFGQSSWEALARYIQDLKAKAEQAAAAPAPQTPSVPTSPATAPQVFTGGGQTTSAKPTFEDFRKFVSDKIGRPATDEDVFYAHERKWINLNEILPPAT